MKRTAKIMDGKTLAEILPNIKQMRERGFNFRAIGLKYGLGATTVLHYYNGYKTYLMGQSNSDTDRIKRAIPYLNMNNGKSSQIKESMGKITPSKKRMTDKELAEALPVMLKMKRKGMGVRDIGKAFNLGRSTVSMLCNGYEDYISGKKTTNAKRVYRALPFLEAGINKTHKAQNKERVPDEITCNKNTLRDKVRFELSVLWGLFTIKY